MAIQPPRAARRLNEAMMSQTLGRAENAHARGRPASAGSAARRAFTTTTKKSAPPSTSVNPSRRPSCLKSQDAAEYTDESLTLVPTYHETTSATDTTAPTANTSRAGASESADRSEARITAASPTKKVRPSKANEAQERMLLSSTSAAFAMALA